MAFHRIKITPASGREGKAYFQSSLNWMTMEGNENLSTVLCLPRTQTSVRELQTQVPQIQWKVTSGVAEAPKWRIQNVAHTPSRCWLQPQLLQSETKLVTMLKSQREDVGCFQQA